MARFEISEEGARDLSGIYDYSYSTYGERQADRYQSSLKAALELLAASPGMGVAFGPPALGLRRFRRNRHVIFYRPESYGVFVVRILHVAMDHLRHILDDDPDVS